MHNVIGHTLLLPVCYCFMFVINGRVVTTLIIPHGSEVYVMTSCDSKVTRVWLRGVTEYSTIQNLKDGTDILYTCIKQLAFVIVVPKLLVSLTKTNSVNIRVPTSQLLKVYELESDCHDYSSFCLLSEILAIKIT